MTLKEYRKKRSFTKTPEPSGSISNKDETLRFCVQKHAARRLHYDFRLELDGVLLSWAIPKGPSLNPNEKRLAIHVEDHPLDYRTFEGVIPKGNYGAGTVMLWDEGAYVEAHSSNKKESENYLREGMKKGHIEFYLFGKKLQGKFNLIEIKNSPEKNAWLLIKSPDDFAKADANVTELDYSVKNKPIKENGKEPPLTNLDKIYWRKERYTKGDVINYYQAVAPYILPYLKNRPLMMHRYPEGIEGEEFYQKNIESPPDWMKVALVKHGAKTVQYVVVQDKKTLLYVANLGSIELHPMISKTDNINCPDFIAIDLDPVDVPFQKVVEVANYIHEFLKNLKIPHYCKTSGGRGLHLYIPLGAKYPFDQTEIFAELLAHIIQEKLPSLISLERMPKNRQKKIYFDYLQNIRGGRTMVAPYSLRAKPGAPVSTPLDWSELNSNLDPLEFNIKTIPQRIKHKGDLFKGLLNKSINLKKIIKILEKGDV